MAMKRDVPAQAGIGFTILVAAATFAVAVVAGIFLIYQSETTLVSNPQLRALAQSQMSLAETPDGQRGPGAAGLFTAPPAPIPGPAP
jgi:hypothetical protein